MEPLLTCKSTALTATKPRNSLVSFFVSHIRSVIFLSCETRKRAGDTPATSCSGQYAYEHVNLLLVLTIGESEEGGCDVGTPQERQDRRQKRAARSRFRHGLNEHRRGWAGRRHGRQESRHCPKAMATQ